MKTVFYFCLFFSTALYAQEAKNPDSLKVKNELDTVHSFKKAIIFSACLPGAGQVYNSMAMQNGPKKAYWKVPLIYAGLGATGYLLISNQKLKNNLKQEYILRDTGQQTAEWAAYDDPAVLSLYQQALSFRDLSILAFDAIIFSFIFSIKSTFFILLFFYNVNYFIPAIEFFLDTFK